LQFDHGLGEGTGLMSTAAISDLQK